MFDYLLHFMIVMETGQGDWDDQFYENAKCHKDELEKTNVMYNVQH